MFRRLLRWVEWKFSANFCSLHLCRQGLGCGVHLHGFLPWISIFMRFYSVPALQVLG